MKRWTPRLVVAALVVAALALGAGLAALRSPWAQQGPPAPPEPAAGMPAGALPGAVPFPPEVVQQLRERRQAMPASYQPRSRHLRPDGSPEFSNRLLLESSPYLLQHAHNPVNWFAWGEEAFALARQLQRPVLLSVGYSTCHWCHVMEEESFENERIAEVMNRLYVAIKVDREERPDVDAIYMSAVQALTGGGGWPMTVWLTPEGKPFFGGSYFPALDGDRGTRTGFLTLLEKLSAAFSAQPDKVASSAAQLVGHIQAELGSTRSAGLPDASVLAAAAETYASRFDDDNGGLRGSPKFPSSLPVRFLLRYHRRTGDPRALGMAELTLQKMAAGGLYDHVGGGFHRYSTDGRWLVPHFEKMLYDNALLTQAYLEGYQATGKQDFARIAREILRYVARDMTSPEGGFYAATDADSLNPAARREEGWFFTWTPEEVRQVLSPAAAEHAIQYFGLTALGNFEGRNILHTAEPLASVARALGIEPTAFEQEIGASREALYQARAQRAPPLRDEKVLTAWNGLMISAAARAAFILADPALLRQAERAAEFVWSRLYRGGRLFRSFKDGEARQDAYLDDHAFLIAGLLDLYEAGHALPWLERALELEQVLDRRYADPRQGAYFLTSDDHETLLTREKPGNDGAEPSGNSVQVLNLLRLYEFTTDEQYRERAEAALRAFGAVLKDTPTAMSEMLLAVDFYLDAPKEILIVAPERLEQADPLLRELRTRFLPNRVLSVVSAGEMLRAHSRVIPLLESKVARRGEATAYVCERRVCELPTSDPTLFRRQLGTGPRAGR